MAGGNTRLLGFPAAAGGADVVERDGAGTEEDEGEGEGGQSQGEFVAAVAHQSVVEVHLGDGDGHIDADGKSSHASEQAQQDEQAANEFGEGGEVGGPGRESEAGDQLSMVVESAEDFVVSVADHDGAEGEAHDEERERLQAVEVAQSSSSGERKDRLQQRDGGGKLGAARPYHEQYAESMAEKNHCARSQLLITFFRPRGVDCRRRLIANGLRVLQASLRSWK